MQGELVIRYKVALASETTSTGALTSYDIALPIHLYMDEGAIYWRQLADHHGRFDPRIPSHGNCIEWGGSSILLRSDQSIPICQLNGLIFSMLPGLSIGARGTITQRYQSVALHKSHGWTDGVQTILKGHWEVLSNSFSFSTWEGLQSGWHFVTSQAVSFGAGVGGVTGSVTLGNAIGDDYPFSIIGAGASIDPGRWIKTAGKALKATIELLKRAPTKSASYASESMFSAGLVIKNPLWEAGQGRMMVRGDFQGLGVFADFNVVIAGGGGVQLLFIGATLDGFYKAVVPNIGQQWGLSIGGGAYGVRVS